MKQSEWSEHHSNIKLNSQKEKLNELLIRQGSKHLSVANGNTDGPSIKWQGHEGGGRGYTQTAKIGRLIKTRISTLLIIK